MSGSYSIEQPWARYSRVSWDEIVPMVHPRQPTTHVVKPADRIPLPMEPQKRLLSQISSNLPVARHRLAQRYEPREVGPEAFLEPGRRHDHISLHGPARPKVPSAAVRQPVSISIPITSATRSRSESAASMLAP